MSNDLLSLSDADKRDICKCYHLYTDLMNEQRRLHSERKDCSEINSQIENVKVYIKQLEASAK